jgi:hypothetical protein
MQVQPDRFAVAALACRVTKTNDGGAMMDYNGQYPVTLACCSMEAIFGERLFEKISREIILYV